MYPQNGQMGDSPSKTRDLTIVMMSILILIDNYHDKWSSLIYNNNIILL